MSTFWSLWIILLTSANLVLVFWVLMANRKVAVSDDADPENKTTGHVYDGIEEYDNPLPKWWFMMFIATFVFAVGYLALYPGMGSWKGLLGWTSVNQLEREQEKAQESYAESYGVFANMSVEELARDDQAMKMAGRIFQNNCAVCHGADAGGNLGFPDLTDNDWLYGGSPEKIKETITHGRKAQGMAAWGDQLGEEAVVNAAEYVLSLGGREHDAEKAEQGKQVFNICAGCHGVDGKGNQMLGAPNLTDDIWLYGGEPEQIRQSIRKGRAGHMPAQQDKLREDKIHLLTAYVYSLSQEERE